MKRALSLIVILSLIFALGGCGKDSADGTPTGFDVFNPGIKQGGIVEGYILRPDTFNPLTTKISVNRRMLSLCFDSLFYIDAGFNTIPRLAESYTISQDGKKITVNLRKNITWHDGSDFSAGDVVYTVNKILGNEEAYYHAVLSGLINKVSAPDNSTAVFTLNYANSGAANFLTFPILKKGEGFDEKYSPNGTGAFMVSDNSNESVISLKRNPYWQCGKVYADGVNLNILPDEDAVYSAFSTGVIDFAQITKDNAGKFAVSENIGYLPTYTDKYTFVGINCNNRLLSNVEVRRAIWDAFDNTAFTKAVLSDYGVSASLPVHPSAYYYDPREDSPSELSSENPIRKVEGKLFLYNHQEDTMVPLEFTLLVNEENAGRCTAATNLASALGDAGISVNVVKTDLQTYQSLISEGDFELYIGSTKLSPDGNIHPLVGQGGNLNYGSFYDEELENSLNSLLTSESVSKRTEFLHNIQKLFYAKMPHIPLYFENEMIVYNTEKLSNAHTILTDNIYSFVIMCCVNE